jgi:hypothetical protein
MPIQAFVDDSGGRGQGQYLVSCALVAHSEQWAAFSDQWAACLRAEPRIEYFKMREAASLSGQFFRMAERQRDEKLLALAAIINEHVAFVVFSSFDLHAHEQVWFQRVKKPFNEPYFWTFHNTIHAVMFELWDMGWRERFEIFFDDQDIFGPRALGLYSAIRAAMSVREPEASALLPEEPVFKSDLEFLPIQACDLIAWCGRRDAADPTNRPFAWLDKAITKPFVSDYSQFYDLERLESVLKMADGQTQKLLSGDYPDLIEAAEKYRLVREATRKPGSE